MVPPLNPVPGVARVVVHGTLAGNPVINVFHVGQPGVGFGSPLTQSEVDAIASGVRSAYASNFVTLLSNQFTLGIVDATDLTNNTGLVGTATGSTAGGSVQTSEPANVSLCISWAISVHYRGGHPRTYIAGLPSTADSDPTTWSSTTLTAWRSAATAFRTALNAITSGASTFQMVAVRRYSGGVTLATPGVYAVTAGSVDSRIDSQRRRLGRDR